MSYYNLWYIKLHENEKEMTYLIMDWPISDQTHQTGGRNVLTKNWQVDTHLAIKLAKVGFQMLFNCFSTQG